MSFDQAADAVRALERHGLPEDQISFVTHSVQQEVPREEELEFGDKSQESAANGAGVGGVVGALLGAPLVAIPGVGPLAAGAVVGGLIGAMSGWGVHKDRVGDYQKKIQEGWLLVVAEGDPEQFADAKRILDATDADEVHLHEKTSADAPEIHQQ